MGSSPTRGSSFFLGKVTALGVLCCFALFVCLTLLASFFLPSHLSFKNMYMCTCSTHCRLPLNSFLEAEAHVAPWRQSGSAREDNSETDRETDGGTHVLRSGKVKLRESRRLHNNDGCSMDTTVTTNVASSEEDAATEMNIDGDETRRDGASRDLRGEQARLGGTCTCCFALFVCLTLLASFFLPSHLSFKNMYMCTCSTHCTFPLN